MATLYDECHGPDSAASAPAHPSGSRAAPLAAMAVRIIGPLIVAAVALWSLPWHAVSSSGSSGAAPIVFLSLATVVRSGARLCRAWVRRARGSRRRMGAW